MIMAQTAKALLPCRFGRGGVTVGGDGVDMEPISRETKPFEKVP
jgi:hypothetical protein